MNKERKGREGIQFVITLQPLLAEERISRLCITIKFVQKLIKKQTKCRLTAAPQAPQSVTEQVTHPKWQHELKYNRLLPYYDLLSKEADRHLAAIKAGLGYTILLRNSIAVRRWMVELVQYIDLNGYRFTKDDHILFVKIMYQFFRTSNMEMSTRLAFGSILTKLLE